MLFDVTIFPKNLNHAASIAQQVEALGFSGLWTAETSHNPFLPLTHAASATQRISIGTGIAVAFPRSPMVVANVAWDLAEQSNGRFILGLGTQVKAHITKRFSTEWSAPCHASGNTSAACVPSGNHGKPERRCATQANTTASPS